MVLNFIQLKDLHKNPTLFWIKNTGPLEVNLIINAIMGRAQIRTNKITIAERRISMNLFQTRNFFLVFR